eukprot:tig00000852_g5027.t1
MEQSRISLLDLPDDLLVSVLQFVGLAKSWTTRSTCRRIRDAVERCTWGGELRAAGAADDPAALERLAALVRDGRVRARADAVSITLKPGLRRRETKEVAVLRLFVAAAAVVEACAAAAAPAAGGAASFEASLAVEEKFFPASTLHEALSGAPPGLDRLTGLHLPPDPKLYISENMAQLIAAKCPRLRSLRIAVQGRWGQLHQNMDRFLGHLSALSLEHLLVRCPARIQGSHLEVLVGTPAGRCLRSLELGDRVRLHSDGIRALFSLPRLERIASKLLVSPEAAAALWRGLERQKALRAAQLILDHTTWGSYLSRLGEAVRRSSLATLHLEFESDVTAPPGGFLPPLLEGAGAVLRSLALTVKEPPAAGDLAALAARGPPLESVLLSLPFSCYQGDLPPGYEVLATLAPLGARLEVRLLRETVSLRETTEHLGTLEAFRQLLPDARVELLKAPSYI